MLLRRERTVYIIACKIYSRYYDEEFSSLEDKENVYLYVRSFYIIISQSTNKITFFSLSLSLSSFYLYISSLSVFHECRNGGYATKPTFGIRLHRRSYGPHRRFVFESLLRLRNSSHPWNEFRLWNEAKLYRRMLSFLLSSLLFLSLSFIYSEQCHASCHLLLYVCVITHTWENLTRIAKLCGDSTC